MWNLIQKKAVKNSSDTRQDTDLRNKENYFYNNFCYNFWRNRMIQQFSKLRNYKLRLSRNSFVHCDLICFSQRVTITVPVVSETLTRPRMDTREYPLSNLNIHGHIENTGMLSSKSHAQFVTLIESNDHAKVW